MNVRVRYSSKFKSDPTREQWRDLDLEMAQPWLAWRHVFPELMSKSDKPRPGMEMFKSSRHCALGNHKLHFSSAPETTWEAIVFSSFETMCQKKLSAVAPEDRPVMLPQAIVLPENQRADFIGCFPCAKEKFTIVQIDGRVHYEPFEYSISKSADNLGEFGCDRSQIAKCLNNESRRRMEAFTKHTENDRQLRKRFHVLRYTDLEVEKSTFAEVLWDDLGIGAVSSR